MKKFRKWLPAMLACALAGNHADAATFDSARDDFRDESIYFVMTTRFYDGDPANNVCGWDWQAVQIANNDPDWRGDFAGLIQKLDYIKALGFTAVWITPVVQNCSGTDFHGYHAMDFQNVDLRYESRTEWGSSADVRFQDLIDAAHAKGMKIILDIVLNHTGNFGEKGLTELFYRSQNIKDQANPATAIIPNYDLLPSNYNDLDGKGQYNARFPYLKNTDGQNHDSHNYYHHVGNGWNWDAPTRWWGQIAGDCVDLNTENPAVSEYLVRCYGKFIEMGVDGFRIDTTGHIARLTFNTAFIPQFQALADKYKDKRDGVPFFMFGECCQRYQGTVTYRKQPALSSYYYQWKSDPALVDQWNWDPTFWDNIFVREGDDEARPGNMALCEQEDKSAMPTSDNALMKNGAWHQPDYSQYSGFSTIDFPSHYGFNNAKYVVDLAKGGDKYYNDASYLVTYVDSHDYCPGPNDLTRFNGGTAQWAENLALMFTFRGIPCLYYGSEVEFQKGAKVDGGGTDTPVKNTGRAYFGHYLEGTVTASDFGQYTASGNVAETLNADLAQHVRRLNLIRAAVPALRRGQYTFDGCKSASGLAYKRATADSYALVAINGGATFTAVPAGRYTDVTTGRAYTVGADGTLTVDAPATKGQLRVVVKDFKGGKIGEDGRFIYTTAPVAHGGDVAFTDPGASQYYTSDDAVGSPRVTFTPASTSFKTETLTVTASLSEAASTGWYQIGSGNKVALTPGRESTFTIGADMAFGQSVTVTWGADTYTGKEIYRKVDPNAVITVYVTAPSAPNIYAWEGDNKFAGAWPGTRMSETEVIDGRTFYRMSFPDVEESLSIIFNNGSQQTANITGITSDVYFEYDGAASAKEIEVELTPSAPVIKASHPTGTMFNDELTVALSATSGATLRYTTDGSDPAVGKAYTAPITITSTTTIRAYAENTVGSATASFTYIKTSVPLYTEYTAYFDNSASNWTTVRAYAWDDNHRDDKAFTGPWPGQDVTSSTVTVSRAGTLHRYTYRANHDMANPMIIFHNEGNGKTSDQKFVHNGIYNASGFTGEYYTPVTTALPVGPTVQDTPVEYYTIQGVRLPGEPTAPGLYIRRTGTKAEKVRY